MTFSHPNIMSQKAILRSEVFDVSRKGPQNVSCPENSRHEHLRQHEAKQLGAISPVPHSMLTSDHLRCTKLCTNESTPPYLNLPLRCPAAGGEVVARNSAALCDVISTGITTRKHKAAKRFRHAQARTETRTRWNQTLPSTLGCVNW